MFIQTETTPNPATLKFLPGQEVMSHGTANFADATAAERSPLATRIFGVDGVTGVFFGSDFVTVTKGAVDWNDIKPAVLGAIMDHYNAIARTLAAGRKIKPIFEEDPNSGETLWEPWIAGFERAMRLDPDGWEEVVQSEDEEASASLLFFLALYEVDQGTSKLEEDAIAEIDATAPDIIPNCVASLHSLSGANRSPVGSTPFPGEGLAAVASHSKPGRNDPCYCGSGRKYKKCCGSN